MRPQSLKGAGVRNDLTIYDAVVEGVVYIGLRQKALLAMTMTLALLVTSLLFGGMLLYSLGFAAFVFSALPPDVAGRTIRQAFPHFYTFVIASALAASALTWSSNLLSTSLLAFIAMTALLARQILMPAINSATDSGAKTRFKWLHAASVVLTLLHIGLAGVVLTRFV